MASLRQSVSENSRNRSVCQLVVSELVCQQHVRLPYNRCAADTGCITWRLVVVSRSRTYNIAQAELTCVIHSVKLSDSSAWSQSVLKHFRTISELSGHFGYGPEVSQDHVYGPVVRSVLVPKCPVTTATMQNAKHDTGAEQVEPPLISTSKITPSSM